jgi:pSer/pThr/pTyr-binding forkhead associated (FHA) protein
MSESKKILRIRLSLKGRVVRSYSLDKRVVTIGRSPDCEVVLDNTGISREHMRIEMMPDGRYQAVDLGSANGTLLNDEPLGKAYLAPDDKIQIGKFTLLIGIESDRRQEEPRTSRERDASQYDNTTVMSSEELKNLLERARKEDLSEPNAAEQSSEDWDEDPEPVRPGPSRSAFVTAVLVAFLLGTAAGAGTVRVLMNLN